VGTATRVSVCTGGTIYPLAMESEVVSERLRKMDPLGLIILFEDENLDAGPRAARTVPVAALRRSRECKPGSLPATTGGTCKCCKVRNSRSRISEISETGKPHALLARSVAYES
jgi:1,6-anhydro-N-acetylmuramate kinase